MTNILTPNESAASVAEGSGNGTAYERLVADVSDASDAWRIKVKLEAKRYGVKIPWKWTKP